MRPGFSPGTGLIRSKYPECKIDACLHWPGGLGDAMFPLVLEIAVHEKIGAAGEFDGKFLCMIVGLANIKPTRLSKAHGSHDAVAPGNAR